jgi:DUF4097 and DUF4098 domain-containing protein YvlB
MKMMVLTGFVFLFVSGTATVRADDWSKTYTVTGKPELRVDTNDGNVSVTTWDRDKIEARVSTEGWRIGPDDVRIRESQSGARVDLDVHVPNSHWSIGVHRRVSIELKVPREDNVAIHTGDGNISLEDVKGDLRLRSGDGRIEGTGLDGSLEAKSGDGNIRVRGRFDMIQLETGDGQINAEAGSGSKMASDWSARSGDGSINLRVPGDLNAQLDLHTGDGHITLDFPVTVSGSVSRSTIRGQLNGGGPTLTVHTGDGSIRLEKL